LPALPTPRRSAVTRLAPRPSLPVGPVDRTDFQPVLPAAVRQSFVDVYSFLLRSAAG